MLLFFSTAAAPPKFINRIRWLARVGEQIPNLPATQASLDSTWKQEGNQKKTYGVNATGEAVGKLFLLLSTE